MNERVAELRRRRPRDRFVRRSCLVLVGIMVAAWTFGGFSGTDLFSERRMRNLDRFLEQIRPAPLRDVAWDWGVAVEWAAGILADRGIDAALSTLAIAILAILLAAAFAMPLALFASRNFATVQPLIGGGAPGRLAARGWNAIYIATRTSLIAMRSLPEYLLAFLLVIMVGPSAWPAVLALAIHNAGILGRLYAETIENAEPGPLRALRGLGAGRRQIAFLALLPTLFARGLLYVFYRWETCVREATVLGMLGMASLGYWVTDARTRDRYDEFLFLIGLGAVIVLGGDLVSAAARRVVR